MMLMPVHSRIVVTIYHREFNYPPYQQTPTLSIKTHLSVLVLNIIGCVEMEGADVAGATLRSDTGSQANITLTRGKEWMEK